MKKRVPPKDPGEVLRKARLQEGFAKEVVMRKLGIDKAQLDHIENWQLNHLPNKSYLIPLLRRYSKLVAVDFNKLETHFPDAMAEKKVIETKQVKQDRSNLVVTSLLRGAIVFVVVGLVLGYVIWQSSSLGSRPELEVATPADGIIVNTPTQSVEGFASAETQVFVNGSTVLVEADGRFETEVVLQKGSNEIVVKAVNNLGSENEQTFTVVRD